MESTQTDAGIKVGAEFLLDLGKKVNDVHASLLSKGNEHVFQMPIYATGGAQIAAGLVVNGGDKMEPPRGLCWGIRWISVKGFTAGSVELQLNNIETVVPFTSAPQYMKFGRGEFLLQPGDKLSLAIDTVLTGSVTIFGRADAVPYQLLTKYLGVTPL